MITVIDSIMGSGKTTWAIQRINSHPEKNFIVVTPLLNEINRFIKETDIPMWQPQPRKQTKLSNIKQILSKNVNIGTTHSLFRMFDQECIDLIKQHNYTLILDETLNIIEELPYNKKDIDILEKAGYVETDDNYRMHWISTEPGQFHIKELRDLENMIRTNKVINLDEDKLLWQFPPEIFGIFDDVYILTYLFESSMLYYYFKLSKINYDVKSIKEGELVDYYNQSTRKFRDLIQIYEGPLNDNYENPGEYALSKKYYQKYPAAITQMKNNIYNYFRHQTNSSGKDRMWTAHETYMSKLSGKGYTRSFVPCNARATNEYKDKSVLAYCLNFFMKPTFIHYFADFDIHIDQDSYALSNMIQWIWRSRIRNEEHINIYIPSARMRELLYEWLNFSA